MKTKSICKCRHSYEDHNSDGLCNYDVTCGCNGYIPIDQVDELDDEIEYCDCGLPFSHNGYCRFCGTHARYL